MFYVKSQFQENICYFQLKISVSCITQKCENVTPFNQFALYYLPSGHLQEVNPLVPKGSPFEE